MPTIAIIGAGPGLGLAIARTFGAEGFQVALVSRSEEKLDRLVTELAADGITAAGFPADVLDRPALRAALTAAKEHFGGIDVLEYSPADASAGPLAPVDVRQATPENVQPQIEYYLYGAMTAADVVLPELLAAGAGTLLFTTGAGSLYPVAQYGNVTAGGAALRNWALNLGEALAEVTRRARGSLITKVDDDDRYGPEHIWDLVLARSYSGATVAGKGAEFVYLQSRDLTVRRYMGSEHYTDVVAGGAMLLSRGDLEDVGGWRPVPRSVDRALLDRVLHAGGLVYRTHGFGFIYTRHEHGHTWDPGVDYFLQDPRAAWRGLPSYEEFGVA